MAEDQVPRTSLPEDWPHFATYNQVAELLAVSASTLYYRVRRGMCPCPVRQGASSRFSREQVLIMMAGTALPGTYTRTMSVRSKGGRKGGKKAAKLRRARDAALAEFDGQVDHGEEQQTGEQ